MALRILASGILLLSVLFLPFWVSVVLAFLGMIYFHIFWEAALLLLLSDFLHGAGEAKFFGLVFVSLIISLVMIITIEFFKKKLKFYA